MPHLPCATKSDNDVSRLGIKEHYSSSLMPHKQEKRKICIAGGGKDSVKNGMAQLVLPDKKNNQSHH